MFKFWKGRCHRKVISSRGKVELVDENKICANHQFNLGTFRRTPQSCLHSLYENKKLIEENVKKLKI